MMESWILTVLVVIPGVWSGNWKVTFKNQCALKGTSVVIRCEYDYPSNRVVKSVYWYKGQNVHDTWRLSYLSPPNNFKYVGDYVSDCSLEIKNVQHTDEGRYYFRFETSFNSWTSRWYAQLSVKDLTTIVEPSTVTEGNNVSLTCLSGCATQTYIVWFRDGQPVTNPIFQARREDAGRYYCAVLGQEKVRSASVVLNVQYLPMNITISMESPNAVEGSSVNLTCSSAANPAADNYTWHKRTDSSSSQLLQVGSGQVLSLPSVEASHTGLYLCQARNRLGENNSTEMLLTVEKQNGSQSSQILLGIGVALFIAFVIILLLFWVKRKTHAEKKAVFDVRSSGNGSSSSSTEDQSNIYSNIRMLPSSPPPGPAAQDFTPPSHRNPNQERDASTSYEDEVTYSTVIIKPKNPSLPRDMNNSKAPQESWSTAGENNDSVIYATVAKSS